MDSQFRNAPGAILRDLRDRAHIADLIHEYALIIRYGRFADCEDLFTEDAVFEVRGGALGMLADAPVLTRLQGRSAILAHLVRGKPAGGGGAVCPMIHNILIRLNGAEASSSCVMAGFVAESGATIVGEYRDTFRSEDRWRFTSRTYTMFHNGGAAGHP
jgi:hypothetical protein